VYTSDILEANMEVFGPVIVELFAASDGLDTDWVVRIQDVYPDGTSANLGPRINGAVLRARFRQGYEKEVLLTPGKPEKYSINIYHIGHTFLKGHRIRLHITSSSFPAIAPNQNTGNPVATDTEWRIANQTIYHDTGYPSAVILPVA
jgi:putative CocE/NonD family hydrolase